MILDSLLSQCEAEGVKLSVGLNLELKCKCTKGKISYDLEDKLKLYKPKLINHLSLIGSNNNSIPTTKPIINLTPTYDDWQQVFNYLIHRPTPSNFPKDKWTILIKALKQFVTNDCSHIHSFINYKYSLHEVFGCHPTHPFERTEYKGVIIALTNPDLRIEEVLADKVVFKSIGGATQTLPRKAQFPVNSITLLDLPFNSGNKEKSGLDIQESLEKTNNEEVDLSFEVLVEEISKYKNVLEQTYLDSDNDDWHGDGMGQKFRTREHTYEEMKVALASFIERVHSHEDEIEAIVIAFTKAQEALPEYQKYLKVLKTHNSSDPRAKEYCELLKQACLKVYEKIPEYKTFMSAKKRQALFVSLLDTPPTQEHIQYLVQSLKGKN